MPSNRSDSNFSPVIIETLKKRAAFICSNPDCKKLTISPDLNSDTNVLYIGRAAHICAASPGGPRYNVTMTDEQRSAIQNAIFLCANCADMIDDNNGESFPVAVLNKWKADHENWITTNLNKSITSQSNITIFSIGQTGGQTAHTIINNKTPKRSILNPEHIINTLKQYPVATYRLHYSTSDAEAYSLACEIDNILLKSGWEKIDPVQRLAGPSLPEGITIFMLKPSESFVELNNQLWQALGNKGVEGQVLQDVDNIFKVHGYPAIVLPENREGVVIFIGPNSSD